MTPTEKLKRAPQAIGPAPRGLFAGEISGPKFVEEIDVRGLLLKLWRRRMVIVVTVFVIMAMALAVVMNLEARYTATASIMLDTRQKQLVDVEAVLSGLPGDFETIESEVLVIQSRSMAAKAVKHLGLEDDPEFNGRLRKPSLIAQIKNLRGWLPESIALTLLGPPGIPVERETAYGVHPGVIDAFLGRLSVQPVGRSRVIGISFKSSSPDTAALAANTLAEFYIVAQMEAKFDATRRANDWLGDRLSVLKAQVEASEQAVEEFRNSSGIFRQGADSTLTDQEISQLNLQLVVERSKRAEAEVRLKEVESLLGRPGGVESASEVLESQLIQTLRGQQAQIERTVASLSKQFGPRHPKMISALAEADDLRRRIEGEVNKIVHGLRNEAAVARARETSIISTINDLKGKAGKFKEAEVQLRALEREAEANQTLFATFLSRSKETTSQQTFQDPDAAVLGLADVPLNASYPRKTLLLGMALVASAFFGCAIAFIMERMDRGIRSTDQIEQLLGVPALGLIPSIRRRWGLGPAPEDFIVKHPNSAFAESIRSLHTSLLLSNSDGSPKVILIASSLPKEGKTSVTLSLANFLAMAGLRVLVIDCDLRRPKLHKHFGVESSPGLVECLSGTAPITDVIHEHPETGAHLVAAGNAPTNPSKLLTSPQMKKVIAGLSGYYEMIIIDSAPTLAVSDTRALCRVVDQAVFLVRWADTPREVATRGLRHILDSGVDLAGVLLSVVNTRRHAQYDFSDSSDFGKRVKKYYTN